MKILTKMPARLRPIVVQAEKNAPTILTAFGCAAEVLTAVLAVRGYKRACDILEQNKTEIMENLEEADREFIDENDLNYTYKDHVRLCWKCYIPAVLMGASGIAAIITANRVNLNRNLALAGAYELSRTAYEEYRAQVVERIGEKREGEIRGEIAQKKIDRNPPENKGVLMVPEGQVLCLDSTSGRYFKSSIENIRRIENELNRRLMTEMWVPLNDLYYELGLPYTTVGRDLGWNINRDGFVRFDYDSALDPNNNPCLVLGMLVEPREDYSEAH